MVTPGKNRFSSSVMVEIGEKIYIVDAGAPVSEMLFQRGISFDKVKTIFITHCHSDHVNGLPFFASLADSHVFPDSKFCELENLKDVKGNNVIIANDNDEINI